MWHQKEVDAIDETTLHLPEKLRCIGTADEVLYQSDKWEQDGDFYPYQHDFSSAPSVFIADGAVLGQRGAKDGRDGPAASSRGGRIVSTKTFLRLSSLHGQIAWPLLAFVEELSLRVPGQAEKLTLRFTRPPMMCCADKKTLVILHDDLIVIRGGSMVVTERGIVR
jgi:hypothetical protein